MAFRDKPKKKKSRGLRKKEVPQDLEGWDKYFNILYGSETATDITASALKAVNVLGEAGVPGAKSLMEWVDDKAYRIGSQVGAGGTADRPLGQMLSESDERGYYTGVGGHFFSGSDDSSREGTSKTPNIFKIFLGMEENTLPVSKVKPSSWTKGDPEQGWRSMKDLAKFNINVTPRNRRSIANLKQHPGPDNPYNKIRAMKEAVASGTYTPEMAVKSTIAFPGLEYKTSVDIARATTSIGYDEDKKQYYYSITDVWDVEPKQHKAGWAASEPGKTYTQAALLQAAGKSIGLYDRYYLPESYMKEWDGELDIEDRVIDDMKRMDEGILGE